MNHKGAIELSVNMLVVIILSLVIFAGGVALLYKFIGGASDVQKDLDQRTQEELERLLIDEGKPVALPLQSATLHAGEQHIFGLGILNIGEYNQFKVGITFSKYIDQGGIDHTAEQQEDPVTWFLYNRNLFSLQQNEAHTESLLVEVSKTAPKGKYIFTVEVKKGAEPGESYGNPQTLIITVQ
ncbi:MAG: hypothetical protein AABX37_05715 [Nanoarchaeota archaeon]